MPKSQMIYKAGKFYFLLVCLFLCTACNNRSEAVFEAGSEFVTAAAEEKTKISEGVEEKVQSKEISQSGLVNINTADAQQLMTLPGIGEVRADAIIEYRQREGDFEKIEDVMNVKGIKTGIFSKISNLICVK